MQRIVDAALASGAQAIHPGYGFLSENAAFVELVEAAGLVFLGPTPEQMRRFGLKHTARELAQATGVPLLPGTGLLADLDAALTQAQRHRLPGDAQEQRRRRRHRHVADVPRRRRAARRLRVGEAPRAIELLRRRRVHRTLHRRRAPHRGADLRRRRGRVVATRRTRLLTAAAQPESGRGNACTGAAARGAQRAARNGGHVGQSGLVPLCGHGGIRRRRAHAGVLLPRGECAAAGRTRRGRKR